MSDFSPRAGDEEWANANAVFDEARSMLAAEGDPQRLHMVPGVPGQVSVDQVSFDEAKCALVSEGSRARVVVREVKVPSSGGVLGLLSCFQRHYSDDGLRSREVCIRVSKVPLDVANPLHCRIMSTLYRQCCRLPLGGEAPHMLGRHWEGIGFQGDDPRTDLRATGMLGPLQFLYLFEKASDLAQEIVELSCAGSHEYPLVLVGFNLSAMAMDCIDTQDVVTASRSLVGGISSVLESLCALYVGAWSVFSQMWRSKHTRSISDFGLVKSDVKKRVLSSPRSVIKIGIHEVEKAAVQKPTRTRPQQPAQDFSSI